MGRNKKEVGLKKKSISIVLDLEVFDSLDYLNINKSELVNWLLKEYFLDIEAGGKNA